MLGRGQYWPIQPSLNHGVPAEITEPATTLAGLQRYMNRINANASRSAIDGASGGVPLMRRLPGVWRVSTDLTVENRELIHYP